MPLFGDENALFVEAYVAVKTTNSILTLKVPFFVS